MKRTDFEELVWEMTRRAAEGEREAEPIDDELLLAYRAGELDADMERRVEEALGDSAAARARLTELAGVEPGPPVERVRRGVLDGDPEGGGANGVPVWRLAAAAMVAAVIGVFAYLQLSAPRGEEIVAVLDGSDFDVSVAAVARARSVGGAVGADAFPGTEVRIRVEAREVARVPFELGVYRVGAGQLRRVESEIEHEAFQGAASVSGPARAFAGTERPGEYRLFLLVAPADRLPDALVLEEGADPRAVLAAAGGRAFSRTLRILPTEEMDREPLGLDDS